jgi:hypothetical protein
MVDGKLKGGRCSSTISKVIVEASILSKSNSYFHRNVFFFYKSLKKINQFFSLTKINQLILFNMFHHQIVQKRNLPKKQKSSKKERMRKTIFVILCFCRKFYFRLVYYVANENGYFYFLILWFNW